MGYKKEYRIGDRVIIEDKEYLLARISRTRATLVNVKNGNRWEDKKLVITPPSVFIRGETIKKYIRGD